MNDYRINDRVLVKLQSGATFEGVVFACLSGTVTVIPDGATKGQTVNVKPERLTMIEANPKWPLEERS